MPIRLSSSHETFSRIFGLAAELGEEAVMTIGPEGISMGLRDGGGARMAWFHAMPEAFDEFEYVAPEKPVLTPDGKPEPERHGIDLTKLHEYVKKARKVSDGDDVEMLLPDKNGKLGLKSGRSKVAFGLIDTRNVKHVLLKLPNIEGHPDMDYRAICVVRGNEFRTFTETAANLVESMGLETVDIITREGKLIAACAGDVDSAEIIIGDVEGYLDPKTNERRDPDACRSIFSLDLITTTCKALPSEEVTFKIGTDVPLIAHYADDGIEITAFVAGRVE